MVVPSQAPDPLGIRDTVVAAARTRHACEIVYVAAGTGTTTRRVIHPYAIVHAEGEWYAVSHCTLASGIRLFRMDRMLSAEKADRRFEVPDEFDVSRYVRNGIAYEGQDDERIQVRYDRHIARWLEERHPGSHGGVQEDGSLIVTHRVADRRWIIAHVLQYGAHAEILEPADLREEVRTIATRIAES